MKKICISKDWKFTNVSLRTNYEDVDLPHDYQIKQKRDPSGNLSNGFYPDTVGKYVKYLHFAKDKRYILDIDGAFMCTRIELNCQMLAMHPYGYTPFLVDLTESILEDRTNKLVITTSPLAHATRWYTGNGIYRDVFLWEGGDIRIEPWDMFISTSEATEAEAAVRLRYTVSSEEDAVVDVVFSVCGPDGTVVKAERLSQRVSKGKNEADYTLRIPSPQLWSIDAPSLYTLKTEIVKDGERVDVSENTFGIKTVAADAKNGLLINGKQVKLRGGCIHHDHGELGAAAFPAAEERKIRLLKEAGFNAVRCAHNPPSIALLECCDRIGMAVMDEAFDAWNLPKGMYDYNLFFEDWWARDISYMVKRDRNHPCVFSYSIGNEILEINGTSKSGDWAEKLSNEIRKYDDTKLVTSGIQKDFVKANWALESIDPEDYKEYLHDHFLDLDREGVNKVTLPYEKSLDIVGVNYYFQNYLFEHEQYPHRVIWGSETHAISFYRSWELTKANSFILGDFTWTAYDNMGEVGAGRFDWYRDGYHRTLTLASYPWRNCYQGDLDLCGFRRPQSYFREAVWLGNTPPRIFTTHPEHFGEPFSGTWWHWYDVDETWTYDDRYVGRPIKAETYTDADSIEWYVNGKKVGESVPVEGIASIDTVYEKGSIRAVAYKNGKPCSEYTLETADKLSVINIEPEKTEMEADGRDLCYVRVSLADGAGRLIVGDDREIECHVHNGELLAFFSGDPKTEDDATSNRCHTFKGRAVAVIRTKQGGGNVTVTVCGKDLAGASRQIWAKPTET